MTEMMIRKSVQNRGFMVDEKSSTDLERLNILGSITQNERNFELRGRTEYFRDGDVFILIKFTYELLNMNSCRFKVRVIDSVGCIAEDTRCLCYMSTSSVISSYCQALNMLHVNRVLLPIICNIFEDISATPTRCFPTLVLPYTCLLPRRYVLSTSA